MFVYPGVCWLGVAVIVIGFVVLAALRNRRIRGDAMDISDVVEDTVEVIVDIASDIVD